MDVSTTSSLVYVCLSLAFIVWMSALAWLERHPDDR